MSILKIVVVASVLSLAALVVLAGTRGRSSRYYRILSAVAGPVTDRLHAPPTSAPLRVPLEISLSAGLDSDWIWYQPELVRVKEEPAGLSMIPTSESVWWMNDRGPMVYRTLSGDAMVEVLVRTTKASDPSMPPDREWQFAGIILRDPRGDAKLSRENYVFNVVGHRGSRLQVETKSTRQGVSRVDAWDWDSGDAVLRIQRKGPEFRLSARPGHSSVWRDLITYERKELPERLQVGLIVYAYSEGRAIHDLQATFERLSIR